MNSRPPGAVSARQARDVQHGGPLGPQPQPNWRRAASMTRVSSSPAGHGHLWSARSARPAAGRGWRCSGAGQRDGAPAGARERQEHRDETRWQTSLFGEPTRQWARALAWSIRLSSASALPLAMMRVPWPAVERVLEQWDWASSSSRLASRMSRQIFRVAGRDAREVTETRPGQRQGTPCHGLVVMPLMSAKAIRCGRWLTAAKAASCASGDI